MPSLPPFACAQPLPLVLVPVGGIPRLSYLTILAARVPMEGDVLQITEPTIYMENDISCFWKYPALMQRSRNPN